MAAKVANSTHKLFVSNLPWTVAHRQLKEYFSQFGFISNAYVVFDRTTGMSKGYGFVTFSSPKELNVAVKKTHHFLEGNPIYLSDPYTTNQPQQ
ncbi:SRA stem-loop-interacting RNA-binding protein, mitochondrial-like [Neodiprion fabricii]|uniref:SRA stem-loop-interacting RNA-binding protein, mitochondrial-like n=1 Tax=Neodiprion fabricii TaxID=2872261 RepID=UPI001ED9833D|nr:SRA stem-loop-interacting RNA-binding protein, mitochondrial-like [Neodiprion fabricii]